MCLVGDVKPHSDQISIGQWAERCRCVAVVLCSFHHRRSQRVHWVHVHPQGGEKFLGPNLQGKVVSAPPGRECTLRGRARVQFFEEIGEIWTAREVVLVSVLRATTKKGRRLFWRKKCTQTKSWLRLCFTFIISKQKQSISQQCLRPSVILQIDSNICNFLHISAMISAFHSLLIR